MRLETCPYKNCQLEEPHYHQELDAIKEKFVREIKKDAEDQRKLEHEVFNCISKSIKFGIELDSLKIILGDSIFIKIIKGMENKCQ